MNFDLFKSNHDIAIELCKIASNLFSEKFNKKINFHHTRTIFDADVIEERSFIDVIRLILSIDSNSDIDFDGKYSSYSNHRMEDFEKCKNIFVEFCDLYKKGGE